MSSQLDIFGTWFSADMRTLCSVLDIAGHKYNDASDTFDLLDVKGQQDYVKLNPGQTNACISINGQKVIADAPTLLQYMCRILSIEKLYPTQNVVVRNKIDALLAFNNAQVKVTTDRLTKITIQTQLVTSGQLNLDKKQKMQVSKDQDFESNIFNNVILANIEQILQESGNGYLTSHGLSVADIAVFNEIANVLALFDITEVDKNEHPLTGEWYLKINNI